MTASTNPVPEHFHTVTPHLVVKDAPAAIEFYKKAFGAEEHFRMHGPDGNTIMHAELQIGDSLLLINEEFPDANCQSPLSLNGSPVTIHLYVDNVDATWEQALDAGARELMPLQNMFWGDRYGKLIDPFGHQWSMASHKQDLTLEQIRERATAAFQS